MNKARMLIVDNDARISALMGSILMGDGHEVREEGCFFPVLGGAVAGLARSKRMKLNRTRLCVLALAALVGAGTLTVGAANQIADSATLTVNRGGTLEAAGLITVNSRGTLLLNDNSTTDRINNTVPIARVGGTLTKGSAVGEGIAGSSAANGGAVSTTDLGAMILASDSHTGSVGALVFAGFSDAGGFKLPVDNWIGTAGTEDSNLANDRLLFAQAPSASEIAFTGGSYEIVPVREPSTLFAGLFHHWGNRPQRALQMRRAPRVIFHSLFPNRMRLSDQKEPHGSGRCAWNQCQSGRDSSSLPQPASLSFTPGFRASGFLRLPNTHSPSDEANGNCFDSVV